MANIIKVNKGESVEINMPINIRNDNGEIQPVSEFKNILFTLSNNTNTLVKASLFEEEGYDSSIMRQNPNEINAVQIFIDDVLTSNAEVYKTYYAKIEFLIEDINFGDNVRTNIDKIPLITFTD